MSERERPIIFSANMVRAILDGRKTQTRRVVKPQPLPIPGDVPPAPGDNGWWWSCNAARSMIQMREMPSFCPYGTSGDRLWVRETWQARHVSIDPETGYRDDVWAAESIPKSNESGYWGVAYAATDESAEDHKDDRGFAWRPSVHMPRWAARILLEITQVRVERLQDISEDDVQAEGCTGSPFGPAADKMLFPTLWDSINKATPWESDPWVWALSFKVIETRRLRRRPSPFFNKDYDL